MTSRRLLSFGDRDSQQKLTPSAPWLRKRTRGLFRASALFFAIAALATGAAPRRALAQTGPCGLHTLRGSYIFTASGHNIVGGVPQPKAIIEAIDFNGDGTLTVPAATVSINGNISRSTGGTGVYTVDDECSGTLTFTPGPSFDIFTDQTGRQAWMIQTNPGTVFQGTVTRLLP